MCTLPSQYSPAPTTGESPTLPGCLKAHPEVLVPQAKLPNEHNKNQLFATIKSK